MITHPVVKVKLFAKSELVFKTAKLLIDSIQVEQMQSAFSDELWFNVDFESLSPAIHRLRLDISFQNESGIYTFVEEYSLDLSSTPHFRSNHAYRLVRMKWLEPGISVLVLALFLTILLMFSPHSSYELLARTPFSFSSSSSSSSFSFTSCFNSFQYRLQRVLSFWILRYLFISFALSLCFGVYFAGKMDGIWFVAFAWGVITSDPTNGFECAFWTELPIWGALECVGVGIPMLIFCMQSTYKPTHAEYEKKSRRRRRRRERICWDRWIPCGVACAFYAIQLLLLHFNFPLHVCLLSANLVIFPLAAILIPVVLFKE